MLNLEACKALEALGYPQGEDHAALFWAHPEDKEYAYLGCPDWGVDDAHGFNGLACPDSHDALDWLAAKLGGEWEKQIDEPVSDYRLWFPSTYSAVIEVGLTPSELIVAYAKLEGM